MRTNSTIDGLKERIDALITVGLSVQDIVVWRNPMETEDQAIKRYLRGHPDIANVPKALVAFRVVSWERQ
jgi:hypothetical protein